MLLTPGLKPVDPALESWWVRPGGATRVRVRPDDRITVVDPDGGQVAELAVLGDDPEALGVRADAPATVLAERGLVPDDARAIRLFGPGGPPGAREMFSVRSDASVVVAAPGGRVVDGDWPASALVVELRRAKPREREEAELPAPLAEPRLDFRVDRASALSYEVREGEYIQIIDVAGRQCSDFLAFHAHKLDAGLERGLDPQVTRTLMGSAYPTVGLHSKYYDADMDPLCRVVQDTVGRHDSFALACTARYYEDLGYPGHVNCTENFNRQLDPYGIAARKGWTALNFFYNTMFDPDLVLLSDEPWSRPGDFVLLRALSDLVCASSACPDDIDPANGWDPTDVHVRIYSPENRFSMAIAHRVTPEADPVMTKETGFHPRWSQLTRNVTEYRGYWLPTCFTNEGAVAEYWACREKAAIMDLSPLRKWEILGPDAEALMQHAVTRDVRRLADGQVVYTALCNETGGMIDDATVFRLAADNFRFVGGDEYDGVHLKRLA
jgi:aminomethyltransferase